nr:hypothetical protein [Tanacetum cinerariifolium]
MAQWLTALDPMAQWLVSLSRHKMALWDSTRLASCCGPLVWQEFAINRVFADADSLPRTFLGPLKACHVRPIAIIRFRPRGLINLLYVIKSPQSSMSIACDVIVCGRLVERLERPFFWIDAFACPALFLWHTSKSVSRDVIPKSSEFSVEHYATLVAYPASFHKYPEPFICLVGMSRNYTLDENTYPQFMRDDDEGGCLLLCLTYALPLLTVCPFCAEMDLLFFIWTVDPTKVRIGERQRGEDEPQLLETTVRRVVSFLPAEQGYSVSGRQGAVIYPVSESEEFVAEDVVPLQPRCQKKRKPLLLRLLAGAVHNAEAKGDPIPTLLFVTSFVSATPKREEAEVDSFARPSAPVITAATTVTSTADPVVVVKEKVVKPSLFAAEFTSAGGIDPAMVGLIDLTGSDFHIGGNRTVIKPESDLQKTYVPQWNVTNGFCLDDGGACREMGGPLNVFERGEKSLQSEVEALKDRNNILEKEKSGPDMKVVDLAASVKVREQEVVDLDVVVTSVKLQNNNLVDQLSTLGVAIGKAVEKGMQDGLSAGITHGAKGRVLTDVAAYNPSAEADYLSALQHLQSVNFSLITELKSNKDASIDTIRVRMIKENIVNYRSALRDVIVPSSEPLSVTALTSTKCTSNAISATVDATTALSVTLVSASLIPPISTDDYEIAHAEGRESAGADANPFSNVDDAELKTS